MNRAFLLTLASVPAACGPSVDLDGSQTTGGEGSGGGPSSSTSTSSTTGGATTGGSTTALGSTTHGSSEESSSPESSTSASTARDATSGSQGSSSSTGGEAIELCAQWIENSQACHPSYKPTSPESLCGTYADHPWCPVEAYALLECEAAWDVDCGPHCVEEAQLLDECEVAYRAEELGCAEIPPGSPAGTLDADCMQLVSGAFVCDAMGFRVPGFSGFADQPDGLELGTDYCASGIGWGLELDASSPCGAAYEDLVVCMQTLDCQALTEFPPAGPSGDCEPQLVAFECRCELGA